MCYIVIFFNVGFCNFIQSDIFFSSSKQRRESEVIETSVLKRRNTKTENHIIPTTIYKIALNSLVGTQLFESTGLAKNSEIFATPARWEAPTNSESNDNHFESTPLKHLTRATDEEKVKLRRKYSNAVAMATPVLSPIKAVMKSIDFGEETSESNSDLSSTEVLPARIIRSMSPVAASDPDLTRAKSMKEVRLRSLFKDVIIPNERCFKQETVL